MEGPSLIIAREEMIAAKNCKVLKVSGNSRIGIQQLKGQRLEEIGSWGKHLLLFFSEYTVKIHFLLWGSYSINKPKINRNARMILIFKNIKIFFYACSVQFLTENVDEVYDWSADVMSPAWDEKAALKKTQQKSNVMICDVLMNQHIFSGVGNIIKNEVLFNLRIHPCTLIKFLSTTQQLYLVREAQNYSWKFYEWKKSYQLRKYWQIMRKKICPICQGTVTKRPTGKLQRLSHFCTNCQILYKKRIVT